MALSTTFMQYALEITEFGKKNNAKMAISPFNVIQGHQFSTDMARCRSFNDSKSKRVLDLLEREWRELYSKQIWSESEKNMYAMYGLIEHVS